MLLEPNAARSVLEQRAATLHDDLNRIDTELTRYSAELPRVALLETEYQRAAIAAELAWTDGVVHDLQVGTLTWSADDFD